MPTEYTPPMSAVRMHYAEARYGHSIGNCVPMSAAMREFDRWLEQVMAEAAARGWAEGFEAGCNYMGEMEMGSPADAKKFDVNPYRKEQADAD